MAFIKKRRGNTTYVYEAKYESIENGKQKYKWNLIGKLDANGNIIPSKKRASTEAASLNNSQNYLNSTSTSTNVGTLGSIGRSDNGNDEIIRTSANSNNDNNVNNDVTTTPMSGMPEMSARHAMPATATNNHVAATPATTYITDCVHNTPNSPVMLDKSGMPVAMSNAKTMPVVNNMPDNISYDTFAETPAEASITVSNDEPIVSQVSEAYEAYETYKIHEVLKTSDAFTNTDKTNHINCEDNTTYGTAIPDTTIIDDTNKFISDSLTTEASQIHQVPQSSQSSQAAAEVPAIHATSTDTQASTTIPSTSRIVDGADKVDGTVDNLGYDLDYADNAPWVIQETDKSSQRNLPQTQHDFSAAFRQHFRCSK
ncbi:MAG: hypothetical protein IJ587_07755 [Synergistaceae bacterium]|nr:hypothetical protein [Synergistaceae bacterium]